MSEEGTRRRGIGEGAGGEWEEMLVGKEGKGSKEERKKGRKRGILMRREGKKNEKERKMLVRKEGKGNERERKKSLERR